MTDWTERVFDALTAASSSMAGAPERDVTEGLGLGVFQVMYLRPGRFYDPRTGAPSFTPSCYLPRFEASPEVRDAVNERHGQAPASELAPHWPNLMERGRSRLGRLGMFVVRHKRAREGRNPQTGELIAIEARTFLLFLPSCSLKSAMNEGERRKEVPEAEAESVVNRHIETELTLEDVRDVFGEGIRMDLAAYEEAAGEPIPTSLRDTLEAVRTDFLPSTWYRTPSELSKYRPYVFDDLEHQRLDVQGFLFGGESSMDALWLEGDTVVQLDHNLEPVARPWAAFRRVALLNGHLEARFPLQVLTPEVFDRVDGFLAGLGSSLSPGRWL